MQRIRFSGVSKSFSLGGRQLLRGHLKDWFRKTEGQRFCALRDVSFDVRDGEGMAVIGANGAGKSTMLNLATRLCYPDEGEVTIHGRVAALLELGSGFHGDLTGEENLYVNAALLGLSRSRTKQLAASIVEFSELGDFIHRPLRTYSTGMVLRLAFSVAIHTEPDVLLIDEVLAVGDQNFQAKCIERMMGFRRAGMTMLCVSHSTDLLRQMCDRAIWLDQGQIVMQGSLEDVITAYETGVTPLAASRE
jgi:ABC-type polysaccharide/polyol phosphate transport system ATPase subunit